MSTRGGTRRGTAGRERAAQSLALALRQATAHLATLRNHEEAYIFDASGRQVAHIVGPERTANDEGWHVVLPGNVPPGTYSIHNHPVEASFSFGDVQTAYFGNEHEMRVVSPGYVYVFRLPDRPAVFEDMRDLWLHSREDRSAQRFYEAHLQVWDMVRDDVLAETQQAIAAGKLPHLEGASLPRIMSHISHEVMQRFAREIGASYRRIPRH